MFSHALATASNQSNYGRGNNNIERCKIIATCVDGFRPDLIYFLKQFDA